MQPLAIMTRCSCAKSLTERPKKFFGDWLPPTPSKGLEDLDPPPPLLSQGLDLALLCTDQCKPRGGGGGAGKGWGFDKFQNFLIKFPMLGNERSIKSVKKDPIPGEKI